MDENVVKFFELYKADPALRRRIEEAELNYPGSLEIRDSVVSYVLLPIASELGLDFDLAALRRYETKLKISRLSAEDEDLFNIVPYWLLDRGWENDKSIFTEAEEKNS